MAPELITLDEVHSIVTQAVCLRDVSGAMGGGVGEHVHAPSIAAIHCSMAIHYSLPH